MKTSITDPQWVFASNDNFGLAQSTFTAEYRYQTMLYYGVQFLHAKILVSSLSCPVGYTQTSGLTRQAMKPIASSSILPQR